MSKLEFDRVYYEKYDTSRINIENGILVLKEHCEILKIDKTKYGYQKAVVQLDQPMLEDVETGEIKTFPSVYKAAQFIDQAPQMITYWARREGAWSKKYKVVIE